MDEAKSTAADTEHLEDEALEAGASTHTRASPKPLSNEDALKNANMALKVRSGFSSTRFEQSLSDNSISAAFQKAYRDGNRAWQSGRPAGPTEIFSGEEEGYMLSTFPVTKNIPDYSLYDPSHPLGRKPSPMGDDEKERFRNMLNIPTLIQEDEQDMLSVVDQLENACILAFHHLSNFSLVNLGIIDGAEDNRFAAQVILLLCRFFDQCKVRNTTVEMKICEEAYFYNENSSEKRPLMIEIHETLQRLPWEVRVVAHMQKTSIDGSRTLYENDGEWKTFYLFDRVGWFTSWNQVEVAMQGVKEIESDAVRNLVLLASKASSPGHDSLTRNALDVIQNIFTSLSLWKDAHQDDKQEVMDFINHSPGGSTADCARYVASLTSTKIARTFFLTVIVGLVIAERHQRLGWPGNEELLVAAVSFWSDNYGELTILPLHEVGFLVGIFLWDDDDGDLVNALSILPTVTVCVADVPSEDMHWKFIQNVSCFGEIEELTLKCFRVLKFPKAESEIIETYKQLRENTMPYLTALPESTHLGPRNVVLKDLPRENTILIQSCRGARIRPARQERSLMDVQEKHINLSYKGVRLHQLKLKNGTVVKRTFLDKVAFLNRLQKVSVCFKTLIFDFTLEFAASLQSADCNTLCDRILNGHFGIGASVWLLSHIYRGNIFIRDFGNLSYLRDLCTTHHSQGLVITTPLSGVIVRQLEFITDKTDLFLNIPRGGKVLQIVHNADNRGRPSSKAWVARSVELPDEAELRCGIDRANDIL